MLVAAFACAALSYEESLVAGPCKSRRRQARQHDISDLALACTRFHTSCSRRHVSCCRGRRPPNHISHSLTSVAAAKTPGLEGAASRSPLGSGCAETIGSLRLLQFRGRGLHLSKKGLGQALLMLSSTLRTLLGREEWL